jgi:hypothetical protein
MVIATEPTMIAIEIAIIGVVPTMPLRRHEWNCGRSLPEVAATIGSRIRSSFAADAAPVELWATPA